MNGGDAALYTFFRRVYDVLNPGGMFVLEPQAWDTYAKAKRLDEVRHLEPGYVECHLFTSLRDSRKMRIS